MRPSVRVPVLSLATTVTQPSVSTALSFRMRAWRATRRCAPSAIETVTMAGIDSGIAATARLTAIRNIRVSGSPLAMPTAKTSTQMPTAP